MARQKISSITLIIQIYLIYSKYSKCNYYRAHGKPHFAKNSRTLPKIDESDLRLFSSLCNHDGLWNVTFIGTNFSAWCWWCIYSRPKSPGAMVKHFGSLHCTFRLLHFKLAKERPNFGNEVMANKAWDQLRRGSEPQSVYLPLPIGSYILGNRRCGIFLVFITTKLFMSSRSNYVY